MDNIEVFCVDDQRWNDIVKSFANHDIYYLSNYVRAFQIHGDGIPELLYYESSSLRAVYVYMKRAVDNEWFDIITPYGYGGVLFEGVTDSENLRIFNNLFTEFMASHKIVDNFVRFHPLLGNADTNRSACQVVDLGRTIAVNLDSEEVIWNNLTSKNRNMIRKAEKKGVEIKYGQGMDLFDEFIRIYNQTMDYDHAVDYYYFKRDFYEAIDRDLKDNYKLFYAVYDEKIIAMSIMLFANGNMHYHLSGSLHEYRSLAPTNLLLYKAALWGLSQGFRHFHLGGGVGSEKDSLYQFKEGFNRSKSYQFSIGKQIFRKDKYDELVERRRTEDKDFDMESSFFPLYRS